MIGVLRSREERVKVRVSARGPFAVGSTLWRDAWGQLTCTVIAKASFELAPGEATPIDPPLPLHDEELHWDEDPARSLRAPSDCAPFKRAAEVVVVGSAFATKPASSVIARVVVGDVDKSVEAFVPRAYLQDGSLVDRGAPASRFSLDYEVAAGGPGTSNPPGIDGLRADARGAIAAAQLLPPFHAMGAAGDYVPTAGFGPVASSWPGRSSLLGADDRAWLREPAASSLPHSFPHAFFQVGPADQWLDRSFAANERIVLEALHPEIRRLVMTLGGKEPRAMVVGRTPRPIRLVGDLLFIDTDRGVCTLTYRGQLAIDESVARHRVMVFEASMGSSFSEDDLVALNEGQEEDPEPTYPDGIPLGTPRSVRTNGRPVLPFAHDISPPPPNAKGESALFPAPTAGNADGALPFRSADGKSSPPRKPTVPPSLLPGAGRRVTELIDVARDPLVPSPPLVPAGAPKPGSVVPPPAAWTPPSSSGSSTGNPALTPEGGIPRPLQVPSFGSPEAAFAKPPQAPTFGTPDLAHPPAFTKALPVSPIGVTPSIGQTTTLGTSSTLTAPPSLSNGAPPPPPRPSSSSMSFDAAFGAAPAMGVAMAIGGTPSGTGAAFGAATIGGAAAMSDAALGARSRAAGETPRAPIAVTPLPASSSGSRRNALVSLLWFDPEVVPRARTMKAFASALEPTRASTRPRKIDEPREQPVLDDRRDLLRLLSYGQPSEASEIHGALAACFDDQDALEPPLVLAGGDVHPTFDELETLRATVAVAQQAAGNDRKVLAAIGLGQSALSAQVSMRPDATLGLVKQIEQAAALPSLPPGFVPAEVQRILVEGRKYKRRTLLGAPRLRAELATPGASARMVVYLPDAAADALPLLASFPVVALCAITPREDITETQDEALVVMALGRVLKGARS